MFYAHCGMTLIGVTPFKQVLLAPEVPSVDEAQNNRQDWFSLDQAVRLGPDRLLGISFGETFEDGKRLSNVDLFMKKLGYRLVDVPGDRLYEWHNPNNCHRVKDSAVKAAQKRVNPLTVKECPTHGLVAHVKDSCSVCAAEKALGKQHCVIHGDTTHRRGRCVSCSNTAFISFHVCSIHGEQPQR